MVQKKAVNAQGPYQLVGQSISNWTRKEENNNIDGIMVHGKKLPTVVSTESLRHGIMAFHNFSYDS
jgi:hypothetical protein